MDRNVWAQFHRASNNVERRFFAGADEVLFRSKGQNSARFRCWCRATMRTCHMAGPKLRRILRSRAVLSQDKGFALLIVVVVLVALSLMVGAIITGTRRYADETGARVAALKLRAAIDGAFVSVFHDLTTASEALPQRVEIGSIAVDIAIRPETAKLDINYAPPEAIARLLSASGIKEERSRKIAEQIADWRGRRDGASGRSIDYIGAGRHYRSPHSGFETLSDLVLILDGGPDLPTCLAPDITIFTHSGDIDASAASERLRRALLEGAPEANSRPIGASIVGGEAGRPDLYEITASAEDRELHIRVRRQLVVRLTGDTRKPIWILADTTPAPDMDSAKAACTRLAAGDR